MQNAEYKMQNEALKSVIAARHFALCILHFPACRTPHGAARNRQVFTLPKTPNVDSQLHTVRHGYGSANGHGTALDGLVVRNWSIRVSLASYGLKRVAATPQLLGV